MTTIVHALFDGRVFRPEEPVQLEPNTRYVLTVDHAGEPVQAGDSAAYPLTVLAALAVDMEVADLAARHDWYARRRLSDADAGNEGTNGDAAPGHASGP